jgi:hypothetical protein
MEEMLAVGAANGLLHLWSAIMSVYLAIGSPQPWAESIAASLPNVQKLTNRFLPAVADPVTPVRFELLNNMASMLTQLVTLPCHPGVKQAYPEAVEVLIATNMIYAEKRLPRLPLFDSEHKCRVHAWMASGAEVSAAMRLALSCSITCHLCNPHVLVDMLC